MTAPIEDLAQLGIEVEVELRPVLVDAYGLGVWIAAQSPTTQSDVLLGWLGELEPAEQLTGAVQIARELLSRPHFDPAWITSGLEHLLRTLRSRKEPGHAQPE